MNFSGKTTLAYSDDDLSYDESSLFRVSHGLLKNQSLCLCASRPLASASRIVVTSHKCT